MSFLTLLENESMAAWLANSAGQLIIISILGFIAVKLLSGKSAPARSVTAAGALVSMLLVFVLSVVFQASNIAWYKADVSRFTTAQPPPAAKPVEKAPAIVKPTVATATEQMTASENISMPALPALPDINMESAFQAKPAPAKPAVISPKPDKPFQLKAVHCINALGLFWLCGIIFMLLKLGYGLAFIRGFRFGLNRVIDARVDRLLKIAADTFNKQRLPELYTSPQVESPVTIGMINPIVIIPEKLFATLSENELKSILLHELAHIYHYDHIIGVFKRIIIAANWWNPLAYRVSAKHAMAREEVADNYVLRELNPKVYSECLAGLAEKICLISSYPAAAGMAGNYSSLQHRVKDIMSKQRKLTMTTGATFKLATAAACVMLALAVAGCRCGKPDPAKSTPPKPVQSKAAVGSKNTAITSEISRDQEDLKIYSKEDLKKVDELLKSLSIKWSKGGEKEVLNTLITKYGKANRVGIGVLCLGLMSKGDEQIKYLQMAIDDFGDCFLGRLQVGAYARYILARAYLKNGEKVKADKLIEEIKTNYPDSIVILQLNLALDMVDIERSKAGTRRLEDSKKYSEEQLKEIDSLYQSVNKKLNSEESKASLNTLLTKYNKANKTGWALLFLGYMSKGDEQIKYLQMAINDFSDCFDNTYGIQVGAYARYLLAGIYTKNGEKDKAAKLIEEIKTDFPDSIDYYGKSLVSTIAADARRVKTVSRMQEDSKTYSKDDLNAAIELYKAADKKWDSEEAKTSLKTLLAKHPKANITGCALLRIGEMSKGDEQIKYLRQAIDGFSDCFWGDGVQVGPYARLLLARIYLKNGEKAEAAKLIEELKTSYPDAVDHKGNSLVLIMALTEPVEQGLTTSNNIRKIGSIAGYWNRFKWWQTLRDLQKTTGAISKEEQNAVDALGQELTANVYLVKFKPNNSFDPATPQELMTCFNKFSALQSKYWRNKYDRVGGAADLKTAAVNNQLIGALLTEEPEQMKKDLAKNSSLLLISCEKVTPEMLVKHSESEQEYLMDKWKTKGPQIVETIPADGAKDVDPNLTEVTVKFDRKMGNKSWSVCTVGRDTGFPINGALHYDDTCTVFRIPVKLQPGHTYATSLNAKQYIGFISADGTPLYPHPLSFTTKAKPEADFGMDKWKTAGPQIIETIPANGAKDVDPGITKIIVKFDRKMRNKSWAVCTIDRDTELPLDGAIHYDDSCTVLTIPVKLRAGHTYATSLNAKEFTAFVSADGTPLYPYPLSFTTKAKPDASASSRESAGRMLDDSKTYSKDELEKIAALRNLVFKQWNSQDARESLNTLLTKYPKSSNTATALSYMGQMSKGDEQIKYLRQVIADFSDCFCEDGMQVGPYARLLLARIYLKNGERKQAVKLLEEIKTSFPDAVDSHENRLVSIIAMMDVDGEKQPASQNAINLNTYWSKFKWWQILRDLQEKTGAVSQKEKDEIDALMQSLIKNIYLVRFKPTNGFDPLTPEDFLNDFSNNSSLRSKPDSVGGASFFRTADVNNHLIGSFLTEEPEQMKADIAKNSLLQLLSCEKVTPETFVKHVESRQESLMDKWKTAGPQIVETIPANGAKDVDPNLTKIIVKFDRKMKNGSWSVCTVDGNSQIPVDGKISYDDSCTILSIPVKLQPGHTYKTSLNMQKYIGFVSEDGIPLYPYPLSFTTKAAPDTDSKSQSVKPEAATAAPAADSVQAANDYQVSGTIPANFEPRANAKGEILFFEPKNVVLVARMNVQADANGGFHISLPANLPKATLLRAEIQFSSEAFAPLRANGKVSPGKPWVVDFAEPFKKQDAVHYTGVFLDDISNEPVPYVGVYADACSGKVLARADEKGRFDFYVAPSWGGMTSFLPWVSSDQYAGHSYFFKHNAGESVELKLIMERGVRVRVHTEDEQGVALPGVYVRWMGGGGAVGTTDEHGDAVLSGMLSRVRPGELTEVRKAGYELVKNPGPLSSMLYTDKPLRIVLRRIAETTLSPAQKMQVTLAQTAAEKWLALVDEGKYPESWTAAATSLKEKETADAWQQTLKTGRGSFGKVLSRKFGGSGAAFGLSQKPLCFNIQYNTVFENKQEIIETIDTIPDKDGQWRVSRYYIRKIEANKDSANIEGKTPTTKSVAVAVTEQALKGWKLSEADAAELEKKVSRNPEDMEALTMLLGYYFPKMKADKNIMQKREKYILWLIANHPEADVLGSPYGQIDSGDSYPEAKKLWLEQLEKHPDDIKITVNTAKYFAGKDDELAIKYFEKAVKLDPKNSSIRYLQLGDIYNRIGMNSNEKSPEAAAAFEKALLAYQNAYANATAKEKESSTVLRPMAAAARKAGNLEKAEKYNNMLVAAKIITAQEKAVIFAPRLEATVAKETGKQARPDVKQRMKNIIFPEVDFKDSDIFSVIRYLYKSSKRYDPDFEGIAIVAGFTKKQADAVPKITMKHTNISMAKLMDDICRVAGMKYRIAEGVVVISVADTKTNDAVKQETAFSAQDRAVKLAQTAAGEWLALVDGGKYPESWTAASAFFKGAVTADAWTQMLKSGQAPFGKVLSRKVKSAVYSTSLPGAPDGQYVVIQYDTTFENKKDAVETVTPMLDKDGQWRVAGYYIK